MRTLLLAAALTLAACGDKSDDTASSGGADAAAECTAMCTSVGFTGGTADEYEHEVNCFCDGTGGLVDDGACTDMCDTLGWSSSQAFDDNACQCS